MSRKVISTENAPKAIGPYSQAIASNGFVFTSGQIPINPESGKIEANTLKDQVRQDLLNLSAVLAAAGTNLKNIVKLTVFMVDLSDFSKLNEVFMEFFPEKQPARSAVQVSRLPLDAMVEIEAIATLE
ncbi:RidA family protein [bacterium]|nr:RidA family protein [bacterium]MBU1065236.1 RidA family protein [bacterium]MBU1635488.1 RidA family protein [bacterium]MBU1873545.1 RidA family protein [bacterium]